MKPTTIVIVALASALAALGASVAAYRSAEGEGATASLIDDLNAAWSAGDAAAVSGLFAPGAVLVRDDGGRTTGSQAIGRLAPATAANAFRVERVGRVATAGQFATTFMRYTSSTGSGMLVSTFQLEHGKILRQWIFTLGRTPPFNDALMP